MPDRVAPQAGTWPVRFRPNALRPPWPVPRPFWVWARRASVRREIMSAGIAYQTKGHQPMTPNRSRIRWIIADPDTGAVIAPEFAVAIDLDRLTAEQIDAATDASELDAIPADVIDEAVMLASLLADGLRWRAWMATPYNTDATRGDSWQAPATVPCASCQLAGDVIYAVDVRAAVVVPWDVMGDHRAYAMTCPECAEVEE